MIEKQPNWFIRLAWSFWAYLVFVILFGAWVASPIQVPVVGLTGRRAMAILSRSNLLWKR